MTKEEFKEELMRRCQTVRKEFPNETAFYVYLVMIACRWDIDKASDVIRNKKKIKI